MIKIICRLRAAKSATLCAVRGAGSLFSARLGRKCGGGWMGDAAPIWGAEGLFAAGGGKGGTEDFACLLP